MGTPHVVIIGGGFGGLNAAKALRRTPVRVTVVDRENHHLFQPLLYQVAMAGLSPADIAVPIRSALSGQENTQVLLADVTRVDLPGKAVVLESGERLSYDYLVVAVGAKTNYFGHEDWTRHALGLKTLDDAVEIRRRVLLAFEAAEREEDADARRRLLTFVVIGGGPTGVEIAGSLVELARFVLAKDFRRIRDERVRVVLVEATDRLLPGGFDAALATSAKGQLEELGAEVRLGTRVTGIDEHGVRLEGSVIEASTVLWTAGVRAKRLAETLGVELDRSSRVKVLEDCSIPGHPEAFAVGDVACFVPAGDKSPLPGVSPVAMQQARFVAKVIRARALRQDPPRTFHYLDKGIMATIGRSRAVAQTGGLKLSGGIAWLAWLLVHIFYLIDFRNRLAVLLNWTFNYLTYGRGARLITGERVFERALRLAAAAERAESVSEASPASPPS
ncbi:MAG TPA: NAD(P)/FAD-dependent oxidoreductase [Polyangiaceae bacterium]|nr:NAD(P)/FAD-dependent oxidoreductase [Polyangiaceae bacterium]